MCSTFKYKSCMGRNYDFEKSFDEEVIFVPAGDPKCEGDYDILGVGSGLFKEYPMFYDAMNNEGLCMSGLAFSKNAKYHAPNDRKICLPPWEMIPHILGTCKSVEDFRNGFFGIYDLDVIDKPFREGIPNSDLHWFLCDMKESVVIESTADGVNVYDNPYGAMTNNPPFPMMVDNYWEHVKYVGTIPLHYETRGKETFGLSGGYTSMERFERLVYLKEHLERQDKADMVTDAFKLCSAVEQLYGLTEVDDSYEYTIYKDVYDMDEKRLYTQTYDGNIREWTFGKSDEICRWNI